MFSHVTVTPWITESSFQTNSCKKPLVLGRGGKGRGIEEKEVTYRLRSMGAELVNSRTLPVSNKQLFLSQIYFWLWQCEHKIQLVTEPAETYHHLCQSSFEQHMSTLLERYTFTNDIFLQISFPRGLGWLLKAAEINLTNKTSVEFDKCEKCSTRDFF